METSLKLAYEINSSPTVAVLAVTKFHFCCIALTCQTYFLQFLNFMSGGARLGTIITRNCAEFCRHLTAGSAVTTEWSLHRKDAPAYSGRSSSFRYPAGLLEALGWDPGNAKCNTPSAGQLAR